jgi:hypothetical protein
MYWRHCTYRSVIHALFFTEEIVGLYFKAVDIGS